MLSNNISNPDTFDRSLLFEILNNSRTPMFVKNRNLQNVLINAALGELAGLDPNEMIGKTDFDLFSPEEAVAFADTDERTFASRQPVHYEEVITDTNNVSRNLRTTKNVFETSTGELLLVGTVHDITELRATQTKLENAVNHLSTLAHTDSLTGLPNRLQFELELENLISSTSAEQKGFSVGFIDLNGFKVINDTAGHMAGDEILRVCSERLCKQLRSDSKIARVGGDEFLLLLPQTDISATIQIINRIMASFRQAITIDGVGWHVSCSIGVSRYPTDGTASSELIRNADFAMYEAKKRKRNDGVTPSSTVEFFNPEIGNTMDRRRTIEWAVNFSDYGKEIEQFYQPIVAHDGTGYQIQGFESLARWTLNEITIPPDEFIPILDKSGGIVPFGYRTIESACEFLAGLNEDQYVSVNLTYKQILDKHFCDTVASTIRNAGINPARLALELTEQNSNFEKAAATTVFDCLKKMGVQTMIDDFGIGQSNLGRLGDFPIDVVKIDKSLVQKRRLLKPVLSLVHELGFQTIVEGIETDEVAKTALSFGADMLQGFYFGHPQPANYDWKTNFMKAPIPLTSAGSAATISESPIQLQ